MVRSADNQVDGLVRALQHVLRPALVTLDQTRVRRAAEQAIHARPGATDTLWADWLVDAALSLGVRARLVECDLSHALEIARGAAGIATLPEADDGFVAVRSDRRRRIEILRGGTDEAPERVSRSGLRKLVGNPGPDEKLPWVVFEIALSKAAGDRAHPIAPLSRLISLLRPEMSDIWIVVVFALFVGLLALATPIAVEALVNTVAFGRVLQPVVVLALILLTFLAFRAAMRALQTFVVEIVQRRLFARVVADLAYRLPRVRHEALDSAYGPELTHRFFDVVTVQKVAAQLLLDGVAVVLGTIVGMAVLAFYHPWLLGFDLILLALIAVIVLILGRGAVASSISESKKKYAMAAWLQDLARCPSAFKMQGAAEFAAERADHLAGAYLQARRTHFRILMRQIIFALALQALASTVLLGLGGWLVIDGQLTLGQLVAAELIVATIVGSFAKLGKHMESFYDLLAAVDKLGQLFDLPVEKSEGLVHAEHDSGMSVRAEGVGYRYPSGRLGLRRCSLKIEPGEKIGIRGPSGSGKSTLAELLYGLRTASDGYLELDDRDVRDYRPDILRRDVALVRGIDVIHGSLSENVHLERAAVGSGEVRSALHRVGLLAEVRDLPDGLDTRLSGTGAPLSDTQLRRLMLARGIAGDPRLLIIDSVLDGLSEEQLDEMLPPLLDSLSNCTVIIISGHRRILELCQRVLRPDGSSTRREPEHAVGR